MMLGLRRPKPQGFQYLPRYYDPVKEEREARLKAAQQMVSGDPEVMKNRISASFRLPRKQESQAYRSAKRKANFRVIIVLIVLLALTLLLMGEFLPQVERVLE